MPRGDGTGPNGAGSMTGRGMGYCAGNNSPGYTNPGSGYGRGVGFGRGCRRFAPVAQPQSVQSANSVDEKEALNQQKDILSKELEMIKERISQLEESKKDQN